MGISNKDQEILKAESNTRTLKEWIEFFENRYTKGQIYGFCYHRGLGIKKISKEEKSKIQSENARK